MINFVILFGMIPKLERVAGRSSTIAEGTKGSFNKGQPEREREGFQVLWFLFNVRVTPSIGSLRQPLQQKVQLCAFLGTLPNKLNHHTDGEMFPKNLPRIRGMFL